MTSSTCWKCVLRSRPIMPSTGCYNPQICVAYAHPFSTSARQNRVVATATPKKGQGIQKGPPARGGGGLKLKKKAIPQRTGKPPAPGERRAMRKRVVLSNTNALEVRGIGELNSETMGDEALDGKVVAFPGKLVDKLRALEAFKPTQGWSWFRKPGTLLRKESFAIAADLAETETKKSTLRRLYVGDRGVGKSMTLLQAMAMALTKDWIVINIPESYDLTNAHTAYAPVPDSSPTEYSQKTYVAHLLSNIRSANTSVLSKLSLSLRHKLPIPLQSNISLDRLAELGAQDADIAWPIFRALWAEISAASTAEHRRPPLMFCVDSIGHIMRATEYRDADFKLIHAHNLALVRLFVEYFSGQKALPNGGSLLAAVSASNVPKTPTFDWVLKQQVSTNEQWPAIFPHEATDERVKKTMETVEVKRLVGLSRDEARGLIEYYAASGITRNKIDERFLSEKYSLSGGGIAGELERCVLGMRA